MAGCSSTATRWTAPSSGETAPAEAHPIELLAISPYPGQAAPTPRASSTIAYACGRCPAICCRLPAGRGAGCTSWSTHSGVTLSPALAELVADEVLDGRERQELSELRPDRFGATRV